MFNIVNNDGNIVKMQKEMEDLNNPIQWLNNISNYFITYLKEAFKYDVMSLTNKTCKKSRRRFLIESKQDSYTYILSKTLKFWIPLPIVFDIYLEHFKNEISNRQKEQHVLCKEIVFFHTDDLKVYLIQDNQKKYLSQIMNEVINTTNLILDTYLNLAQEHRKEIIQNSIKDVFKIGHSFMQQLKSNIKNHDIVYCELEQLINEDLNTKFGKNDMLKNYKEELEQLRYKCNKIISKLFVEKNIDYDINLFYESENEDNKSDLNIIISLAKDLLGEKKNNTINYLENEIKLFNKKWSDIIGYQYEKMVILNEEYDEAIYKFSSNVLKKYDHLIDDVEKKTKTKILENKNNIDNKNNMLKDKLNSLLEKMNKYRTNMSLNINAKISVTTQKAIEMQKSRVKEFVENVEKILYANDMYSKLFIFKNNLLFSKKLWEMIFFKNKRYRIT